VSAASSKRAPRNQKRRPPQSLEETLEILGASELRIDSGHGELLNDSSVRHLKVTVQQPKPPSPFAKLLDRIAEKARKK
jgi:hypothetical protein